MTKDTQPQSFPKTVAALAEYDRLDLLVDEAPTVEEALDAMDAWGAARMLVAEAFADETSAYNHSRQTVLNYVNRGAGLAFVRRLVANNAL